MKQSKTVGLVSLLALAACGPIAPEAYTNRGDPENLIDVSSEVVNLELAPDTLPEISGMVGQEAPVRADLNCMPDEPLCKQAKQMMDTHHIPARITGRPGNVVALYYERIVAHDCENRYIDNSINPYNLPPPTFGCSLTANTVHMVSDKRQFTNPNLLDYSDGEKAAMTYENYLHPENAPAPKQENKTVWTVESGSSGGSQ